MPRFGCSDCDGALGCVRCRWATGDCGADESFGEVCGSDMLPLKVRRKGPIEL